MRYIGKSATGGEVYGKAGRGSELMDRARHALTSSQIDVQGMYQGEGFKAGSVSQAYALKLVKQGDAILGNANNSIYITGVSKEELARQIAGK